MVLIAVMRQIRNKMTAKTNLVEYLNQDRLAALSEYAGKTDAKLSLTFKSWVPRWLRRLVARLFHIAIIYEPCSPKESF